MRSCAPTVLAVVLSLSLLVGGPSAPLRAAGTAGSLDPTFGTGGKVLTNVGQNALPSDAVLQANGDIVVSLGVPLGVVR